VYIGKLEPELEKRRVVLGFSALSERHAVNLGISRNMIVNHIGALKLSVDNRRWAMSFVASADRQDFPLAQLFSKSIDPLQASMNALSPDLIPEGRSTS